MEPMRTIYVKDYIGCVYTFKLNVAMTNDQNDKKHEKSQRVQSAHGSDSLYTQSWRTNSHSQEEEKKRIVLLKSFVVSLMCDSSLKFMMMKKLLFLISLCLFATQTNGLQSIYNPLSSTVSCGENDDCNVICNGTNICQSKEFIFNSSNNVITMTCLGASACASATITSRNHSYLSLSIHRLAAPKIAVTIHNDGNGVSDIKCLDYKSCEFGIFNFHSNYGDMTSIDCGDYSCYFTIINVYNSDFIMNNSYHAFKYASLLIENAANQWAQILCSEANSCQSSLLRFNGGIVSVSCVMGNGCYRTYVDAIQSDEFSLQCLGYCNTMIVYLPLKPNVSTINVTSSTTSETWFYLLNSNNIPNFHCFDGLECDSNYILVYGASLGMECTLFVNCSFPVYDNISSITNKLIYFDESYVNLNLNMSNISIAIKTLVYILPYLLDNTQRNTQTLVTPSNANVTVLCIYCYGIVFDFAQSSNAVMIPGKTYQDCDLYGAQDSFTLTQKGVIIDTTNTFSPEWKQQNNYYLETTNAFNVECGLQTVQCLSNSQIYLSSNFVNIDCTGKQTDCYSSDIYTTSNSFDFAFRSLWNIQCNSNHQICANLFIHFNDVSCRYNDSFPCLQYMKTSDPTSPSYRPTTTDPTSYPPTTTEATTHPTNYPTSNRTDDPTSDPTHHPTKDPSVVPTQRPSFSPSRYPTASREYDSFFIITYLINDLESQYIEILVNNALDVSNDITEIIEISYFESSTLKFRFFWLQIEYILGIPVQDINRDVEPLFLNANQEISIKSKIKCDVMACQVLADTNYNLKDEFEAITQSKLRQYFATYGLNLNSQNAAAAQESSQLIFEIESVGVIMEAIYPSKALTISQIMSNNKLLLVLVVVMLMSIIISFLAFLHSNGVCCVAWALPMDGTLWFALIIYVLQWMLFVADINLCVELALHESVATDMRITFCLVSCIVFIAIPYATNLYFAGCVSTMIPNKNLNAIAFFKGNTFFFMTLMVICGGCYPVIFLLSSSIFGLQSFNSGLTNHELRQMNHIKLVATVALQNIPQIIVQCVYSATIQSISANTAFAFITAVLSIICTPFVTVNMNHTHFTYCIEIKKVNATEKFIANKGKTQKISTILARILSPLSSKHIQISRNSAVNEAGLALHVTHFADGDVNISQIRKLYMEKQAFLEKQFEQHFGLNGECMVIFKGMDENGLINGGSEKYKKKKNMDYLQEAMNSERIDGNVELQIIKPQQTAFKRDGDGESEQNNIAEKAMLIQEEEIIDKSMSIESKQLHIIQQIFNDNYDDQDDDDSDFSFRV